jgi:hypothetical protein
MLWENRTGGSCPRIVCSAPFVGTNDTTAVLTQRLGFSPQKYYFDTPINATTSISKFWFEVDEHDGTNPTVLDNGGTGYQIDQDHVLFDPVRSSNNFNFNFKVVAAVSASQNLSRLCFSYSNAAQVRNDTLPSRVYANVMWRVSFLPNDTTIDFQPATGIAPTAGYAFYQADVPGPNFQFDLFSTVGGITYSEDARDTRNVVGMNDTLPFKRNVQKRMERQNLRWELRQPRGS